MVTVIIVDDEKLELETLEFHIAWEHIGACVVGTARNGSIGLEMVDKYLPDIVITDIKMPVMNGIDLSQKVKARYPDTCIIYLSGYEEFEYAKEALKIGVSDYFLKPVYLADFEKRIGHYISVCEQRKIKKENLILESCKLLNPYLTYEFLYNDLVVTRNDLFKERLEDFFHFANSTMIGPDVLRNIALDLILRIYGAVGKKAVCDADTCVISKTLREMNDISEIIAFVLDHVEILRNSMMIGRADASHQLVELIKQYIADHYSEPISIDNIADMVYLSAGYMRGLFKNIYGCTVWEYLTRIRMEKAAELLRMDCYKVHEIAVLVGYDNVSYFCGAFQKRYGATPKEYRKKVATVNPL